jgi:hypothetical protein
MEMNEPSSKLGDQLVIQLLAAPPGWDGESGAPTLSVEGTPLKRTGDAYQVKSGTWIVAHCHKDLEYV